MAAPWEVSATQPASPSVAPGSAPWEMPPVKGTDGSGVNAAQPPPSPTPPTPGYFGPVVDLAKSVGTAAEGAVADVIGLPRTIQDYLNTVFTPAGPQSQPPIPGLPDWAWKPNLAPAPAINPPEASDVRQAFTSRTGLDYQPSTTAGRVAQAGTEAGMAGLLGGPEMFAPGFAGGALPQLAKEYGAPDWMQSILGLAAPIITHTAVTGPESLVKTLVRPNTAEGQMAAAQQVLDQAASNPDAPIGQPPIADAPHTLGQATNDPGLLGFEKSRFQTAPNDVKLDAIKSGANEAATGILQTVGKLPDRGGADLQLQESAANMQQTVKNAQDASLATQKTNWTGLDPGRVTAFDTAPMKQDVNSYVADIEKARQKYVPTDIVQTINDFSPAEPLRELQAARSDLLTQQRELQNSGQYNKANVVGELAQIVGNHVDNLVMPTPDLATGYENARMQTAQHHQLFDQPAIQTALNRPPSQAGAPLMTPEGFDAYYNATGGSSDAVQHARDYFMAGLARSAEAKGAEEQKLLPAPYSAYIAKNAGLLNDPRLFTPEQANAIRQAGQQLDYTMRTQRATQSGMSPTYQLLSGNKYAQALVGQTGAKVLSTLSKGAELGGTGLGAIVGAGLGSPTTGALVGGTLGRAFNALVPSYETAGQKILGYVDRALADPNFAAKLRQYRPNPNASQLPSMWGLSNSGLLGPR